MNLDTAKDLATFLKVSLAAIRKWTSRGMPCIRAGRLVRYDRDAVLEWFRAQQRAGNGGGGTEVADAGKHTS